MPDSNATMMTDIHDIKPVLSVGSDLTWPWWLLGVLILLGLIVPAWWLWRGRKQKQGQASAPPPVPPDVEALRALDELAAGRLAAKDYYFRLSAVLRCYMERRYGFPAQEMTTEELQPILATLDLSSDLSRELKTFCGMSDLIKFADAPAARSRMQTDLTLVRRFVEQTMVKEEETNKYAPPERIEP